MTEKLYPTDLMPWNLEPHYCRHVSAMTTEELHGKADIATQLAWRDQQIEALRAELAAAKQETSVETPEAAEPFLQRIEDLLFAATCCTGPSMDDRAACVELIKQRDVAIAAKQEAPAGPTDGKADDAPGLTVGQLRQALVGAPSDLPVTVRTMTDDAFCGGITSAIVEDNCGGLHFALDCSEDPDDFDDDAGGDQEGVPAIAEKKR